MITNAICVPTIPVTDLDRAHDFYTRQLGLSVQEETEGMMLFRAGSGTMLGVYQRPAASSSPHTLAVFIVDDVEVTVDALSRNGIRFEQYDLPEMGIVTDERGITVGDSPKSAWFKDPEGNILAVSEIR